MKNQFGYVKSKPESGNGKGQQPPISRPAPSPLPPPSSGGSLQQQTDQQLQLNSMVRGLLDQQQQHQQQQRSNSLQAAYHHQQQQHQMESTAASLLSQRFSNTHQSPTFSHNPNLSSLLSGNQICIIRSKTSPLNLISVFGRSVFWSVGLSVSLS